MGNAVRLSLKSPRFLSNRLGPPQAAERQAVGQQLPEKKAEAEWLAKWLVREHPNSRPLAANTIRNNHLSKYENPASPSDRARK